MEESASSKRTVRQAATDRSSSWANRLQSPTAMAASAAWLPLPEVGRLEFYVKLLPTPAQPGAFHAGRAPPFSLLG